MDKESSSFLMSSIAVDFPYKCYPSQIAMMSKVVRSIVNEQNAIIESPTGTGKTLSLLCAILAASKHYRNVDLEKYNARLQKIQEARKRPRTSPDIDKSDDKKQKAKLNIEYDSKSVESFVSAILDEDDEDFAPAKISVKHKETDIPPAEVKKEQPDFDLILGDGSAAEQAITRIYYGTRTHKQISQVISELQKTKYRPRIAILGSRNQLCINAKLKKESNKNDACNQLLDDSGCFYYERSQLVRGHRAFHSGGAMEIFDIEDLVTVAKKVKGCPYFAARTMAATADLVFCPYNYLIDPSLRETLNINLKNSIMVIDEAHNIEDSARGAGSFEMSNEDLELVCKSLQAAIDHLEVESDNMEPAKHVLTFVSCFEKYEKLKSSQIVKDGFESETYIWSGLEFVTFLEQCFIKKSNLKHYVDAFTKITNVEDVDAVKILAPKQAYIVKPLLRIVEHVLCSDNGAKDYSIGVVHNRAMNNVNWLYKIGIWCLNPGVIFSPIAKECRSVILASGTLSPLSSFASELETPFAESLEAAHIIDDSRIWAAVVDLGQDGTPLKGTFGFAEKHAYQDGVGQVVVTTCETVQDGVLVFFSSYGAMKRLVDRWKLTGLYQKIAARKRIFEEPRDGAEFETSISEYYSTVKKGGAAYFGVFRGKISEGIDFANEYARAVIAIGIPFPHLKDAQVSLKRKFNDKFRSSGLLNGNEWYEIQAFRAYNQALGRCIRHRNDWGALLMVDSRMRAPKSRA
eukprot:Partr_v1_DN27482_c3_g1_i1_m71996 putative helicase 1